MMTAEMLPDQGEDLIVRHIDMQPVADPGT